MRWRRRSKGWNRSFGGRKKARQPERPVYLRTLSNLSNPSEVRGVLSMWRSAQVPRETALTASQVELAHQMLPFRYSEVVNLSSGSKALLFAAQEGGGAYSELHMSAGERAILRLSQDIAQLKGALILIDELEAGLHPWVQQLLMAQLQQLALRNDLQVIVTTHSPVVLDAVPRNGRIFLERDRTGEVTVKLHQLDALYNSVSDAPSRIAKTRLRQLAENLGRTGPELARAVGRLEAEKQQSDIQPLVQNLKGALLRWRDGDAALRL